MVKRAGGAAVLFLIVGYSLLRQAGLSDGQLLVLAAVSLVGILLAVALMLLLTQLPEP